MEQIQKAPIILTGPPGSGKSAWIQRYARELECQLFVCPCRKDRTLRDGRQRLHVWARRTEPAILWLEGADDLTPEAQAFLRRILETHAQHTQFILECRDAGKLQEPIRSRCTIRRVLPPSWNDICHFLRQRGKCDENDIEEIRSYLDVTGGCMTYRQALHCEYLKTMHPSMWSYVCEMRRKESAEVQKGLSGARILDYIEAAYNPETLIDNIEIDHGEFGECIESSGSLWAFLGSALLRPGAVSMSDKRELYNEPL